MPLFPRWSVEISNFTVGQGKDHCFTNSQCNSPVSLVFSVHFLITLVIGVYTFNILMFSGKRVIGGR